MKKHKKVNNVQQTDNLAINATFDEVLGLSMLVSPKTGKKASGDKKIQPRNKKK